MNTLKLELSSRHSGVLNVTLNRPEIRNAFNEAMIDELTHVFSVEVKKPDESKYPWDYMKIRATIPAAEAFRPMSDGGCPLVKTQ